jgi:tellurite resistance protein TehA-like permease
MGFVLDSIERMLDKVSPKVSAALAFPAMLIVSAPFAYITGTFSIILSDQFFAPGGYPTVGIGYAVGIAIGLVFASWASYGMYNLASEVHAEAGEEMPTA